MNYLVMQNKGASGSFNGSASRELKKLIAKEKRIVEETLGEIKMRVQEFKVCITQVVATKKNSKQFSSNLL